MTTVTVTAGHIARGIREDAENCAVALALHDAFPDATCISVSPEGIEIQDDDSGYTEITPPREAQEFIWDFDDGNDVQPFTFTLDYPAAVA